ncbi:MAG TPA: FlgD immunoglobulin-like domain containing protein [Prolixibacteraceae bacterium]|jgi:hypothetical protein
MMKKLIYIVLIAFFSIKGFAQGITTDTTPYLLATNLDNYSAWSFSRQSGTLGTVSNYNGLNGNGLQLTYNFPSTGGWVNLEIPVGSSFTKSNPMVFFIYTANSLDNLEIKLIDQDGSVFMVKPALAKYAGGWTHVTAYLDNMNYAWGGNTIFDTPSRFSLAISGAGSSSGRVCFDEIGIGKAGLVSSFMPTLDPDRELAGVGFAQRRDLAIATEDPLVLKYLEALQDQSTLAGNLLPTYQGGTQAQTFNNCLVAMAFLVKNERARAERILDFYLNATDSANTNQLKQNFFYNREARGFFQECDIHTLQATGAKNRWIGDMAWLLISCKNYQQKYNSDRYDYLVVLIKNLFLKFYKEAATGGYIQHGWEYGDTQLHESYGHHEGNIDCYVAMKLCGEDYYAHQIKIWIDGQLNGNTALPLDLYTWRVLAFGAMGESYTSLLNIPEYDFRYRKIINVHGKEVMGMYSSPDITIQNFWNDGTGHISCAFQSYGDRQRGYFYANQLDPLLVSQVVGTETSHGIPYTLNTQGYAGVNPAVAVISSSAWYILAKNGCNPFLSGDFKDNLTSSVHPLENNSSRLKVFPNPFTTQLTINYKAEGNSLTSIRIFNGEGLQVKTIEHKALSEGNYSFTWDGCDDEGIKVNTGVYLIQLLSDKYLESSRILYLKAGSRGF